MVEFPLPVYERKPERFRAPGELGDSTPANHEMTQMAKFQEAESIVIAGDVEIQITRWMRVEYHRMNFANGHPIAVLGA